MSDPEGKIQQMHGEPVSYPHVFLLCFSASFVRCQLPLKDTAMLAFDKEPHFLEVCVSQNNSHCEAVEKGLATSQKTQPRLKMTAMVGHDATIYGVLAARGMELLDTYDAPHGSSCSSK